MLCRAYVCVFAAMSCTGVDPCLAVPRCPGIRTAPWCELLLENLPSLVGLSRNRLALHRARRRRLLRCGLRLGLRLGLLLSLLLGLLLRLLFGLLLGLLLLLLLLLNGLLQLLLQLLLDGLLLLLLLHILLLLLLGLLHSLPLLHRRRRPGLIPLPHAARPRRTDPPPARPHAARALGPRGMSSRRLRPPRHRGRRGRALARAHGRRGALLVRAQAGGAAATATGRARARLEGPGRQAGARNDALGGAVHAEAEGLSELHR